MVQIFLSIINMSISASYIVLAVLLLRLLLKKAPKWITVVLWGIVAVRLVCPFSIESILSLIPSAETVSPDIMMDMTPEINTGIPILNQVINPVIIDSFTPDPFTSANPLQIWIPIFTAIWVVGMAALFVYTIISYARVRRRIGTAVIYKDNIYQSESVTAPFVLGIIKPKIYLPFNMNDRDMEHVVAHETAHIRRKDHLWKPLGFLLLTLHWFNPLMWLGYVLLCRDIEIACDEKVIGELDRDARADYSEALLSCSVNRRMIAACPLAFGEVGVKDRVKSVLNYKKPAFWIIIAAIIACVAVAVCFLTNPPSNQSPDVEIFTEHDGIYVTLQSITRHGKANYTFDLVWHNDTNEQVTYGEMYSIERQEGNEWKDLTSDIYFITIGYLLNPHRTANKSYSTEKFNISESGNYRLIVPFSIKDESGYKRCKTWIEFYVNEDLLIESAYVNFVEYLNLDDSDGLYVFVWQMAKDSYSFGLVPGSEIQDFLESSTFRTSLKGVRAKEMRDILSTYDIEEDKIHIIPWQNPLSSYIGDYWIVSEGEDIEAKRQAYIEEIRGMLFGTELEDDSSSDITDNSGNVRDLPFILQILDYGCSIKDVKIELKEVRYESNDLIFNILWQNNSPDSIDIGPDFEVYRYDEEDSLEKLEEKGEGLLYKQVLLGNFDGFANPAVVTYNLSSHYDVSQKGTYRFEAYGAWVDFEIILK